MNLIDKAFARQFARDALLTVPGMSSDELHEFVNSLSERRDPPNFFALGLPVWVVSADGSNANETPGVSISFGRPDSAAHAMGFQDDMLSLQAPNNGRPLIAAVPVEILSLIVEQQGIATLSATEVRLAAQLLSGLSLAEAADEDAVAYETRRNQFKSLAGKLGVSRQQDVLRLLLQDLLVALAPAFVARQDHEILYTYKDQFLPEGVRIAILSERGQATARVLEYGPQSGRPVLVLHPMIFPDIIEENLKFAHDNDLRIIFPLRGGLLQSTEAVTTSDTTTKAQLADLNLIWQTFCGEPVPVIAMVSSGAQATAFAMAHPEKVASITYAATCFSAGYYKPSAIYFGSSLAELALRSEWMLTRTMTALRTKFGTLAKFEPSMRRIFAGSPPDSNVLEQEFSAPLKGERIMSAVLNSEESIRTDYFNQVHFNWAAVRELETPVRFVHGDADSIHSAKDMRRLGKLAGCSNVEILDGVGHLIQHAALNDLIAKALRVEHLPFPQARAGYGSHPH